MIKIAIIGAGGLARDVLDVIEAVNTRSLTYDFMGWVLDKEYYVPGTKVNDYQVLGDMDWIEKHGRDVHFIVAVGQPADKKKIVMRATEHGCRFISLIHPSAVFTKRMKIGIGSVVFAGCVLSNNISVGDHVTVNIGATLGHDAIIDDYCTISPGAHISGNVTIEEGAFIGTGANIIEKLKIGSWSNISAGCTVVADVNPNESLIAGFGKVFKTKPEGWQEQ